MAEEHIVVDDAVIDEAVANVDVQAVIDPVWASVNIYEGEEKYKRDLDVFSRPQQYVFAIWWYQAEVNNGGHYQFYANSTGIVWEEALTGLREVGLAEVEQILRESVKRMGGHPSKDKDQRFAQVDSLKDAGLEDLDTRLYEYEMNTGIGRGLLDYIQRNRSAFHFDGIVNRSWG